MRPRSTWPLTAAASRTPSSRDLKYGKAKGYATVPAGEYDLEVRPAGEKKAAFDIDPLTLEAGKSYSAMAIGQLGGGSFNVILVEDAAVN